MTNERFSEHDANQGAQSQGEFLGMTGNSAWYLLGSAGAGVLLVIVLWGMLGCSLLVCLGLGAFLCASSVAYVFALKNNRPAHYDTDFFESALIEAGVLALTFGPNDKRPPNPFRSAETEAALRPEEHEKDGVVVTRAARASASVAASAAPHEQAAKEKPSRGQQRRKDDEKPTVPLAAYERLRDDLNAAEEALEEALSADEEDGLCV